MLSLVVVSFAYEAHLEGKIVSAARKKLKCAALADSGMELAKSFLDHSRELTGSETEEEKEEDNRFQAADDLRRGKSVSIRYNFTTREGEDAGSVRVDIEPEDSLRNVNNITEEDWERMFNLIGLPEDYWPELIDSFYDWTDPDNAPRENGAETDDYYATLEKPYSSADKPLDSVRELLLIKGFTEPILTGGILNPEDPPESQIVLTNGVSRLLTTYGEGKVNINAVRDDSLGLAILQTLPGITEIEAHAIIEERESSGYTGLGSEEIKAFESVEDARTRLAEIVEEPAFFDNITVKSEIFRITSTGQIGRVTKRISAIVYANGDLWRILRWSEEQDF